jgi:hypothetical protein
MTYNIPTHLRGSVRTALSHFTVIDEDQRFEGLNLGMLAEGWWNISSSVIGWANELDDRQVRELLAVLSPIAEYAAENNYGAESDELSFPEDVKLANQSEEIIAWFTDVALTSALR